ncbi:acetyltransferase, ribosomal protein N-acetylase [Aequorivita sublithincola DSM 14238]|uniref:Acetyltransferase, ribosomal protein N-acetylase n=1 Tax=Aequorivita sublithincola (strain DSM 14238 / LMG 21431 / ACAM 643 / 9-3) TaxID=746697 RepID=I3Z070_AEQSU|nr:GNAT family N-acetyltransferase [Aequorivita sublithincola]AFL82638.1 acetyltransferase, ribosomal protein N-acetylase [Aequorivita sublithincola DSM 14238]
MERNIIKMAIPFPIITTERLNLRKVLPTDAERVFYFRSNKEINKYIKRPPQTREMSIAHIQLLDYNLKTNKGISWGITTKDSNVIIGNICLWNFSKDKKTAEVGYDLDPKFQGQGIMSEALKAVLHFAFEIRGFETIEAYTDYRNIPSKKLLKLHGFIPNEGKKDTDNQNNEVFYINH